MTYLSSIVCGLALEVKEQAPPIKPTATQYQRQLANAFYLNASKEKVNECWQQELWLAGERSHLYVSATTYNAVIGNEVKQMVHLLTNVDDFYSLLDKSYINGVDLATRYNWCSHISKDDWGRKSGITSNTTMVFEADHSLTFEQMFEAVDEVLISRHGLQLACVKYTGGKSIHFILKWSEPLEDTVFRATWEYLNNQLRAYHDTTGWDAHFKSPAQASRTPLAFHASKCKPATTLYFAPVTNDHAKLTIPLSVVATGNKSSRARVVSNEDIATYATIPQMNFSTYRREGKRYNLLFGVANTDARDKALEEFKEAVQGDTFRRGNGWQLGLFKAAMRLGVRNTGLSKEAIDELVALVSKRIEDQPQHRDAFDSASVYKYLLSGCIFGMQEDCLDVGEDLYHLSAPVEAVQWCTDYLERYKGKQLPKLMVVKSCIGTGKTSLASSLHIDKYFGDSPCILFLFHRRSLGIDFCKKNPGFVMYDDSMFANNHLTSQRLLCCTYDSASRLLAGTKNPCFDLVIMDEIDQGLEHVLTCTGTHVANDRPAILTAVKTVLEKAATVLAISATASDLEVGILEKWCADVEEETPVKAVIHRNTPKLAPELHKNIRLVSTESRALQAVVDEINNGGKVILHTDSKSNTKTFEVLLRKELPDTRMLVVNGETVGELKEIAQVYEYDLVICNQSLSTGVDIEQPHFSLIAGVFNNPLAASAHDCKQSLGRSRKTVDVVLYVDACYWGANVCLTDEAIAEEAGIGVDELTHEMIASLPGIKLLEICLPGQLGKQIQSWQVDYIRRAKLGRINRRARLVASLIADGHNVSLAAFGEELEYNKHEVKQLLKQEYAEAIVSAASLDDTDLQAIETRVSEPGSYLNPVERLQLARAYTCKKLLLPASAELEVADVMWLEANGSAVCENIKLLREDATALAEAAIKKANERGVIGDIGRKNTKVAKAALLKRLVPLLPSSTYDKSSADVANFMAAVGTLTNEFAMVGIKIETTDPVAMVNTVASMVGKRGKGKSVGKKGEQKRMYTLEESPQARQVNARLDERQAKAEATTAKPVLKGKPVYAPIVDTTFDDSDDDRNSPHEFRKGETIAEYSVRKKTWAADNTR